MLIDFDFCTCRDLSQTNVDVNGLPSGADRINKFREDAESANPHGQECDPEVIVDGGRIDEGEDEGVASRHYEVDGEEDGDRGRVPNEAVNPTKRFGERPEQ